MNKFLKTKYWWMGILILFTIITMVTSYIHCTIDLTSEKRFTLTQPTKNILENIQEPIEVEVYLTGDLPTNYKKLSVAVDNLLNEYGELSHHNIHYSFEIPGEGMQDSIKANLYDSLARLGVIFENNQNFSEKDQKQSQQLIIPSAIVKVEGKRPVAIDLRSSKTIFKHYNVINDIPQEDKEATLNAAEALLEYKFSNAIDKLTRKEIPTIAYLVGNGEPIDLTVNDLGESLRNDYRLGILDLKKNYPNPKEINTLIIVKPSESFTENDKIKLDQYVMHGGKIIWFIDKLYASLDSIMNTKADYIAYDRNLQLDDILFKYGVRINGDLVQDLNCAKLPIVVGYNPDNSPKMQRMPWPYFPFLNAVNENPITKNIDRILPLFPSSIDTVNAEGIKKTVLLATDTNSRAIASPALVSLNSWQDDPNFTTFNKAHIPVAVLLEGKFKSLYANRLTKETIDTIQNNIQSSFLNSAEQSTQQIVVSDAGIVTNTVNKTSGPLPMGVIPFDEYRFANKDFLLNSVDYLTNKNGLFVARNKNFVLRLLDKEKVEAQRSLWQTINIVIPILIVILIGFLFQYNRKRKYQLS